MLGAAMEDLEWSLKNIPTPTALSFLATNTTTVNVRNTDVVATAVWNSSRESEIFGMVGKKDWLEKGSVTCFILLRKNNSFESVYFKDRGKMSVGLSLTLYGEQPSISRTGLFLALKYAKRSKKYG